MSYDDIRNAREGFVDMRAGDSLIRIESIILAVISFIAGLAYYKLGFVSALIVAVIVAGVFPWLAGLIKIFAWIIAILFSFLWAVIAYFIIGECIDASAGVVAALIVFIASFFMHKIFSGLGFASLEKIKLDSMRSTSQNTSQISNAITQIANESKSSINDHENNL